MVNAMHHKLGYLHLLTENENEADHVARPTFLRKTLEVQVLTVAHNAVDAHILTFHHLVIHPTHKIRTTVIMIRGSGHRLTVRYPHPTIPPIVFGVCTPPEVEDANSFSVPSRSLGS